jgi:hypothetical protein
MHDHRTGPVGPHHPWSHEIASEAVALKAGPPARIESHEYSALANSEGGVLCWEELSHDLRSVLYGQEVLTVDEVRDLATDRELQAVAGIGPANELAILKALAATDRRDDWLSMSLDETTLIYEDEAGIEQYSDDYRIDFSEFEGRPDHTRCMAGLPATLVAA